MGNKIGGWSLEQYKEMRKRLFNLTLSDFETLLRNYCSHEKMELLAWTLAYDQFPEQSEEV